MATRLQTSFYVVVCLVVQMHFCILYYLLPVYTVVDDYL
jgi:hypothetical protein